MKSVQKYYDQVSGFYDDTTGPRDSWTPPHETNRLLLPLIDEGTTVLDAGIGTGRASLELKKAGASVCGFDLSVAMLQRLHEKDPEIELHHADLDQEFSFLEDREFDIAVSVGALEFATDLRLTLERLIRHLRRGGFICFTYEQLILDHPIQNQRLAVSGVGEGEARVELEHQRHTPAEVETILKGLGLSIVEHFPLAAYPRIDTGCSVIYGVVLGFRRG